MPGKSAGILSSDFDNSVSSRCEEVSSDLSEEGFNLVFRPVGDAFPVGSPGRSTGILSETFGFAAAGSVSESGKSRGIRMPGRIELPEFLALATGLKGGRSTGT